MFSDNETERWLACIKANVCCLPSRLEEIGATLENPTDLVRKPENALDNVAGDTGKLVSSNMKSVLVKDTGYRAMCSISRVLMGE
jgi:hypothetical protein